MMSLYPHCYTPICIAYLQIDTPAVPFHWIQLRPIASSDTLPNKVSLHNVTKNGRAKFIGGRLENVTFAAEFYLCISQEIHLRFRLISIFFT